MCFRCHVKQTSAGILASEGQNSRAELLVQVTQAPMPLGSVRHTLSFYLPTLPCKSHCATSTTTTTTKAKTKNPFLCCLCPCKCSKYGGCLPSISSLTPSSLLPCGPHMSWISTTGLRGLGHSPVWCIWMDLNQWWLFPSQPPVIGN